MKNTPVALAALSLCLLASAHAADASPDIADKLAQQIGQMQQQLDAMKQELARVKAQNEALAAAQARGRRGARAPRRVVVAAPAPGAGAAPSRPTWACGATARSTTRIRPRTRA